MEEASSVALVIFGAAVVFSIATNYVNRRMGITKRRNELQKSVNDFQKRYQEAVKKNDAAQIDRLKDEEKAMMKDMQEMMFLPFKSMIVILPLFFVFIWLAGTYFPQFTIRLPIALHLNGSELFGLNILHESTYGPRGFFILASVLAGSVIEFVAGKTLKN